MTESKLVVDGWSTECFPVHGTICWDIVFLFYLIKGFVFDPITKVFYLLNRERHVKL